MLKGDRVTTLICYKYVLKNMENWTYPKPAVAYRESGLFAGICYRKNKPVDLGDSTQCCSKDTPALHSKSDAQLAWMGCN